MKIIIALLFMLIGQYSFAQTMPDFDLIKLEKRADYKPAEPFVMQTCNYLLTTPIVKGTDNRMKSMQFIFKWMSGSSDFAFTFDDPVSKMIKDNADHVGLYMAGMAKYALEHKAESPAIKLIKLNGITAMLTYCENKNNNTKITKPLKKLIEARDAGTLEQMF